ncbi:MAG TPA: DDE-type integrase/transposase/recombinase [Candidatus Aquicultor sp.]
MPSHEKSSAGISQRIDTELCVAALIMAITARRPAAGLVHHSDRGVQYASERYVQLLKEYGFASAFLIRQAQIA